MRNMKLLSALHDMKTRPLLAVAGIACSLLLGAAAANGKSNAGVAAAREAAGAGADRAHTR